MTDAQLQVFDKIEDMLQEHFDGALLVVVTSSELPNGRRQDHSSFAWHGGQIKAIGLAEFAKSKMLVLAGEEAEDE